MAWPMQDSRSFAGMTRIRFKGFSPTGCLSPVPSRKPDTPRTPLKESAARPLCPERASPDERSRGDRMSLHQVRGFPEALTIGRTHQLLVVRHQGAGDRPGLVVVAVDRTYRDDLRGGAAQEDLAGLGQLLRLDGALLD